MCVCVLRVSEKAEQVARPDKQRLLTNLGVTHWWSLLSPLPFYPPRLRVF